MGNVFNMIGGASGGASWDDAILHIYAEAGSTVTVSNGVKTITLTEHTVSGANSEYIYNIAVADYGTWTITGTLDGKTASKTQTVSDNVEYEVQIFYGYVFTYTGTYSVTEGTYTVENNNINITSENFTVELRTSGTLTPIVSPESVDIHCVGGGAGGVEMGGDGAGGGSGFTTTTASPVSLVDGNTYTITIGAGGVGLVEPWGESKKPHGRAGSASSFSDILSANPGQGGSTQYGAYTYRYGGSGGSGGCSGGGAGGYDGSNASGGQSPGTGQGTTTRDFADSTLTMRAGGGTWNGSSTIPTAAASGGGYKDNPPLTNYGGGGGGASSQAQTGGSGIVIFRNHRAS